MARAVVPSTAAAVDHADTELIGHDGQLGDTGFQGNDFPPLRLLPPAQGIGSKHNDTKRSNYHNLLSPGTQNLGQHQNDLIINF